MLKYGIFSLIALVVVAGGWVVLKDDAPEIIPAEEVPVVQTEARIELSSAKVPQGETLVVQLLGDIASLRIGEERVPFSQMGSSTVAIVGFDTRAPVGTRTLTYEGAQGIGTATFEVVAKEYPVTRIVIPPDLVAQGITSDKLVESIVQTDNVTLADILAAHTEEYHFSEPFVEPTDEWVDVGGFGNVREDGNSAIRHLGTDLEGETGDPVYATNRGVVVYAGELQNFGNSIVVDHGLGIFSIYLHLSSLQVDAGAVVVNGERIGSIGNTGAYTLEPHLHFSIKVRGVSVDPRTFIDTFVSRSRYLST